MKPPDPKFVHVLIERYGPTRHRVYINQTYFATTAFEYRRGGPDSRDEVTLTFHPDTVTVRHLLELEGTETTQPGSNANDRDRKLSEN